MCLHSAIYVMIEVPQFLKLVLPLWKGTLTANHVLWPLHHPVRQCGEVNAWGGVHVTLIDDGIIAALEDLLNVVGPVAASTQPITVDVNDQEPLGVTGTALVIRLVSPGLSDLRTKLIPATRSVMVRAVITDAHIQIASWWIRSRLSNVAENLAFLDLAWRVYQENGSPPVPATRHFGLPYFVKLIKQCERARDTDKAASAARAVEYFLKHGEPAHYRKPASGIHTTIASGLLQTTDTARLISSLDVPVRQALQQFQVTSIAVMTEDLESDPLTVQFYDWLTETYVEETRPGLKVHSVLPLGV